MRRFIAALGAVALAAVIPATPALAEGAILIDGDYCYSIVPDSSGQLTGESVVGTFTSRTTKSGITNFKCHFNLVGDEIPATTVKASGFWCNTPGGLTNDTSINANSGGSMVMSCTIKK